jgi:futalosine hydrolase
MTGSPATGTDDGSVEGTAPSVLVVVAVAYEGEAVNRCLSSLRRQRLGPYEAWCAKDGEATVRTVVGGVGPACAAAATAAGLALEGRYSLVLSAGIAGGFRSRLIEQGDLVVADEIVSADLGVVRDDGFACLSSVGPPLVPSPSFVSAAVRHAGAVAGTILTLSTMTGTNARALELSTRYSRAVGEAMEGAGVAIAARRWKVPFGELRAISNPVGRYDKSTWTTERALDRLAAGIAAALRHPLDR